MAGTGLVSGIGSVGPILDSIVKNTDARSDFSVIMAKKALNVQKDHGAEAVKLINSASIIRSNKVDAKA